MRIASYSHGERPVCAGVVVGDLVHPFPGAPTGLEVVRLGLDTALALGEEAAAGPGVPLDVVRLRAPLQPASIRDFVAFEEHVEGVRRSVDGASGVPDAWYDAPTFYFTNPHTVLGPDEEVAFPATSTLRDFELEVAVVVGRDGSSLSETEARDHVFGYTILDDWSARDLQSREMQVSLGPAKGKDFATTLGPWIVTADELDDRRDGDGFLELECRVAVNGVEVGGDLLSHAGWTFEAMIAHASRDSRVVAGDVLGSGTVGGGGCLAELWGRRGVQDPPPLRPGDVVTLTVEGIGSLTNRVAVAPPAPAPVPVRRPRGGLVSTALSSLGSLAGRTVVVTGAASGIGAAVVARATTAGARVVGLDASPVDGSAPFDVRDEAGWGALADRLGATGGVHGLVNAAGVTWRERLGHVTADDYARVQAVNVVGPMLGIQALSPLMPPGSSIVNVGSLAALQAHPALAYTASKWALRGLTHAACLELGSAGVRVNAVHPGFVETPMTAGADALRAASLAATPLGRLAQPDDVAAVVCFLLGDGAAHVSGAEIPVDGGVSSHGGAKPVSDALRPAYT